MKNLQLIKEELKKGFDNEGTNLYVSVLGEYCDNINIGDLVSEVADNNTEIYTKKLFEMAWDLYKNDYIDRAILEFGETDLVKIFQLSDYLRNEEVLYNNLELLIQYYAIEILEDKEDYKLIEDKEDFLNDLKSELEKIDNNNTLRDIEDVVINTMSYYL